MAITDAATGQPLPDNAIQRVLFVAPNLHVYQIPPIQSTRGFNASQWTSPTQPTAQQIFTANLRVIETSIEGKLKADIVLEDGNTGELFAAAPYTSIAAVQLANDSSRFFAIRVQGEGGMKATLGIGFEDRSPAFDFGVALSEIRKVLGMEGSNTASTTTVRGAPAKLNKMEQDAKKDFSLKEGQTINVQLGSKGRRPSPVMAKGGPADDTAALFSIAPPPGSAKAPVDGRPTELHLPLGGKSAAELGFDDGEFGEFQ